MNELDDVPEIDERGRVNINPLLALATVKPEEAARNIKGASAFGINPDSYAPMRETLDKEIERRTLPTHIPRAVAEVAGRSQQNASLLAKDTAWPASQSYLTYMKDQIESGGINRKINDLLGRKILNQTVGLASALTDDEEMELTLAKRERDDHNKIMSQYQYSYGEKLPAEMLAGVVDFGRSLWESKDLALMGATGGVGWGAAKVGLAGTKSLLPLGLKLGGLKGAMVGVGVGLMRDAQIQSTGEIYGELIDHYEKNPTLNPEQAQSKAAELAVGGATLVSLLELIPVSKYAKYIPFINKVVNPKWAARLARANPAMANLMTAFARTGLAEGGTEAAQEVVSIFTKSIGETYNGTETEIITGLTNAALQWRENIPQVVKAGIIGTGVGVAVTGAGRLAGKAIEPALRMNQVQTNQEKEVLKDPAPPIIPFEVRGTQAVNLATLVRNYSVITKNSQAFKHLPDDVDNIRQQAMDDAGIGHVFIDIDELKAWATDDKKAVAARNALDPSGVAAGQVGAPIRVDMHKFLRLVDEFPTASELLQVEADSPSAVKWKLKLDEFEQKRQKIEEGLPQADPVKETDRMTQEAELAKIDERLAEIEKSPTVIITDEEKPMSLMDFAKTAAEVIELMKRKNEILQNPEVRLRNEDINNQADYLHQQTFTPGMYNVIPEAESSKLNAAQVQVRMEVAEAINDVAGRETEKVINLEKEMNLILEHEYQQDTIENEKDMQLVESYLYNEKQIDELTPFQETQKSSGKPIYTINPETLSEQDRATYGKNKTLSKRGVFHKDGADAHEVATVFGLPDAATLLDVLSKTPTREEATDAAVAKRQAGVEQETRDIHKDTKESKVAKAYDNVTRMHLKELKILLERYWPTVKKGIKRIALSMPKMPELMERARNFVGQTQIKQLNSKQFEVAERQSQRKSVEAILDNQVEVAFREKENAAYTSQLAKETRLAIGRVNKMFHWIANLTSESIQAELKEAGKIYLDAVNSIMDVYNFDPRQKNQTDIDAYNRYVQKMNKIGQTEFRVPPEVMEWLTPKASAKELTVDQLSHLHDRLRRIVHNARLKNTLIRALGVETVTDVIAEQLRQLGEQHPAYDPKKANDDSAGDIGAWDKASRIVRGAEAFVQNIKGATNELGAGVLNNLWEKVIWQAIEGSGSHAGPYGLKALDQLQSVYRNKILGYVKAAGKDFQKLGITKVFVPEFEKSPHLNYGKLTKLDLFRMLLNVGTKSNKKRVMNFFNGDSSVTQETVKEVLERELSVREFDFAQKAWNTFRGLKDRVGANYKTLTGQDLEFLEPSSFTAFGKVYEGGYSPIILKRSTSIEAAQESAQTMERLFGKKSTVFEFNPALEGMVNMPHTKERTDHNHTIDLDVDAFGIGLDQILYGITMAVPIRDVMTLLNNEEIATTIKSILGTAKYEGLRNSVAGLTNSYTAHAQVQHAQAAKLIGSVFSFIEGAMIKSWLLFNHATLVTNFASFFEVMRKMGGKSFVKYMSLTATRFANPLNWRQIPGMIDRAKEMDPTLFRWSEGLADHALSTFSDAMPKKYAVKNKVYKLGRDGVNAIGEVGLNYLFGLQDSFIKTMAVHAAYSQYLAGEAPGHSIESINQMTDAEKDRNAMAYAGSLAADSTMRAKASDKSPVQTIPIVRAFSKMFNEMRNIINNVAQNFRNNHYDAKKAVKLAKEGDFVGANIAFNDIGARTAMMLFIAVGSAMFLKTIKGKNPFATKEEDEDKPIALNQIPMGLLHNATVGLPGAMVSHILGASPVVRSMLWSAETGLDASIPVVSGLTAIGKAAHVLTNLPDELNMIQAFHELGPDDFKKIAFGVSVLSGGLPVNELFKIYDLMTKDGKPPKLGGDIIVGAALKAIDTFTELFDEKSEDDKALDELLKRRNKEKQPKEQTQLQDAVDHSKEIKAAVEPKDDSKLPITDAGFEVIKYAESNGDPRARPTKTKTVLGVKVKYKLSDAFGWFQFLPATWSGLVDSPEGRAAGLTINGRTESPRQQEKAARILAVQNARRFRREKVPVNLETIYFGHHFDVAMTKYIYGPKAEEKLPKELLTEKVLAANYWLKGFKTTQEIRDYINERLAEGKAAYRRQLLKSGDDVEVLDSLR